jgi:hypothetical protein
MGSKVRSVKEVYVLLLRALSDIQPGRFLSIEWLSASHACRVSILDHHMIIVLTPCRHGKDTKESLRLGHDYWLEPHNVFEDCRSSPVSLKAFHVEYHFDPFQPIVNLSLTTLSQAPYPAIGQAWSIISGQSMSAPHIAFTELGRQYLSIMPPLTTLTLLRPPNRGYTLSTSAICNPGHPTLQHNVPTDGRTATPNPGECMRTVSCNCDVCWSLDPIHEFGSKHTKEPSRSPPPIPPVDALFADSGSLFSDHDVNQAFSGSVDEWRVM